MARFARLYNVFIGLMVLGLAALIAKQGIAIAEHGVGGWLRGDGQHQTEWEVRAVVGLLLIGLPALVLVVFVRSGEGLVGRLREWRWVRAMRRSRDDERRRRPENEV